ncbi:MAG: TetR family transcriptional regulator [Gaiellaceae bacterium]|jgi:AcrR family transcriptional regulator|nr:MAG: TetR family transcriptional regulator [Gaiellaceae bacterium]
MTTATRQTADERREAVLEAAGREFAKHGFHGASTDAIARSAGISQPYLFRLFGSKKELYIASVRRCFRRTLEAMQAAAEGLRGDQALQAIGDAYARLLAEDPSMLQAQLQAWAAALDDEDVRAAARDAFGDIYAYTERVSGATPQTLARFHATGMLLNVMAAIGLLGEEIEPWGERLVEGCRTGHEWAA